MPFQDVYIVECVRSPIGRGYKNGALHNIMAVGKDNTQNTKKTKSSFLDLLAMTLAELMKRAGVSKSEVEDVICGCVSPVGEQVQFR
jgi:acetyl-CoA acyltransferase